MTSTPRPRPSAHVAATPTASELLRTPGALLTRSHLRALGLGRRAIDCVFRACAVIVLPGHGRPMVRAEDFLALVEEHTFRGDRVRPTGSRPTRRPN